MVIREEALAGAAPGGVSISHLVLRKRRNEVLEKTERRLSLSSSSTRTTKIRKIQGISVATNEQPRSRASACQANAQAGTLIVSFPSEDQFPHFELLFGLDADHFKISFGSRRCCNVREH